MDAPYRLALALLTREARSSLRPSLCRASWPRALREFAERHPAVLSAGTAHPPLASAPCELERTLKGELL